MMMMMMMMMMMIMLMMMMRSPAINPSLITTCIKAKTDVERVPGSCQDQQCLGGLAQWPEPARQRTFVAAPLHLHPAITPGSYLGQHADPSGF